MDSLNVGVIGYISCAIAFCILSAILFVSWRGKLQGGALLVASVISIIWASIAGYQATTDHFEAISLAAVELLRDTAWLTFLFIILYSQVKEPRSRRTLRLIALVSSFVVITVGSLFLYVIFSSQSSLPIGMAFDVRIFSHVILAVVGLILIEQLYRNASPSQRWSLKYLCLGIGGLFVFDLYLYADALLLKEIDLNIWLARGYINGLIVPLIAVSAARNPDWSLDVYVSRQFVFHTATLMGVGVYLIAMAIGGYYIKLYGESWGSVAQLTFLFGALVVLVTLLFSGQMRAYLRVFLSKHFFNYRYDYREEWLRFTNALSETELEEHIWERVISALAETVESPGGLLWLRRGDKNFQLVASKNLSVDESEIDSNETDCLVRFLQDKQWVIDLDDYRNEPALYEELKLPRWIDDVPHAWLIVPLLQQNALYGFAVLIRSRVKMSINWENRDLLKTTGRQAANYLALYDANQSLIDAKQFDAFNRLSAYVVHDLKNIVAQLSLVVKNAEKHKNNAEFIDDAFLTIGNAVQKMNRMLGQLRKERTGDNAETGLNRANLITIAQRAINDRLVDNPKPVLETTEQVLYVAADLDRLLSVLEHLLQNAQDATEKNGQVILRITVKEELVMIEIIDTGCGMDSQFIRDRLFRPFDTTKGNAGMGVGVYESREFVLSLGGQFEVHSKVNEGTTIRIKLKLAERQFEELQQIPNNTAIN